MKQKARKYDGREGQHAWDWVNKWYNGRTEVQIINDLGFLTLFPLFLNSFQFFANDFLIAKKYLWGQYEVKVLGAIIHDNRTGTPLSQRL